MVIKEKISPLTKDIMGMYIFTQDHTMERVIESINACNITESVIENLGTATATISSTATPTVSIVTATTTSTIAPPTKSIDNI